MQGLGLAITADFPLANLEAAAGDQSARRLEVRGVDRVDALPPGESANLAAEHDLLTVESHPALGYRIAAAGHGSHLLSPDGRRVLSTRPQADGDWRWSRLFFAQVLPCAAALQGLEVLHASAVRAGGSVTAFVARSGGGKSSLCAHLVAGGAEFFTDDVLALEPRDDGVLAHPGPSFVTLDPAEQAAMEPEARGRLGRELGRAGKLILSPPAAATSARLSEVMFLERGTRGSQVSVERLDPPDPRLLLSSTFVAHLPSTDRLVAQLEACAQIARRVPCLRLRIPEGVSASEAAAVLARR